MDAITPHQYAKDLLVSLLENNIENVDSEKLNSVKTKAIDMLEKKIKNGEANFVLVSQIMFEISQIKTL